MTPETEPAPATRTRHGPGYGNATYTLREPEVAASLDFQLFTRARFLRESAAYLGLCMSGERHTAAD